MKENICCFIGHRNINETQELKTSVFKAVEELIKEEKVNVFLFGSKSQFNSLCLEVVSKLKEKYPYIKRIYVRAEFPVINDDYKAYLLGMYDETYYPGNILGSGRAVYVERNFEMIKQSRFCVVYYDESNKPSKRKSGTKIALQYAVKLKREVILFT